MQLKELSIFVMLLTSLLMAGGCKPKYRQPEVQEKIIAPDQASVIESNQLMIRQNAQLIRDQATVRGWTLTETGTGVFYQRYPLKRSEPSKKIEPGDRVSLEYEVRLLNGVFCYSSKDKGLKQFIVEKSDAESGLHEVIQLLHPGDSALVVIPPHRAFGLTGDGDRIPPRAILVYDIRIDSVIRHQNN
ncbi:MAG: FKBP-type peptidyl-prolyl cis-trans isomerase [Bacteroidales bacterium]|nr:FKBP-type peptidyl-prolyl cis-trans isomerase [Bacteroidales bacterium]